jgi:recombination protein RecR
MYFVLGGTISLASDTTGHLRLGELLGSIPTRKELAEIVLAFPANPEGDATAARVHDDMTAAAPTLRITTLGRGLSTGSELEYADPETLRSALANRK